MVTRVAMQGKEWDLVEGYYLWFSQDGKQWKVYSEGGDNLEANVRVSTCNVFLSVFPYRAAFCFVKQSLNLL